jgi:hypothetical protein
MPSLKFLNSLSKETDTLKLLDSINIKNHRTALSRLRCGNFNIRLRKAYKKKLKGKVFACFVDFRKAYDSVDHSLLWNKLINKGISSKILTLLKLMYKDISCRIKSKGHLSEEFFYSVGVRQGCVLSPLLFILFINDIVDFINKENIGIAVGDAIIFILLYADDIILLADNESYLQQMVSDLQLFCNQSKMVVNTPKTKWMIFERRCHPMTAELQIFLSSQMLERVDSFKYLGIFFSTHLNFSEHLNFTLLKAEKAAHLFWRFVGRFHSLNTSVEVNIFNSQKEKDFGQHCQLCMN